MFPGKTKAEEFTSHLETEYMDKKFTVGKMAFNFKVEEGECFFEYEFKSDKKQEEAEEQEDSGDSEDEITFDEKTLSIRVIPYEGNSDGILYELIYLDEKQNKAIKYRYRHPEFNIDDDNLTNSKDFFEISSKSIKKLIKKLKKNI